MRRGYMRTLSHAAGRKKARGPDFRNSAWRIAYAVQLRLGADVQAVGVGSRRGEAHLAECIACDFVVAIARAQDEGVAILAEKINVPVAGKWRAREGEAAAAGPRL